VLLLHYTGKNGQGDRTCTCMFSVPSGVADCLAPHPEKLSADALIGRGILRRRRSSETLAAARGLARAHRARPCGLRLRRPGRAAALRHTRDLGPKPSALAAALRSEKMGAGLGVAPREPAYETGGGTARFLPRKIWWERLESHQHLLAFNESCRLTTPRSQTQILARTAGNAPASGGFGDRCLACRPRP
jgi:hypothetical protein